MLSRCIFFLSRRGKENSAFCMESRWRRWRRRMVGRRGGGGGEFRRRRRVFRRLLKRIQRGPWGRVWLRWVRVNSRQGRMNSLLGRVKSVGNRRVSRSEESWIWQPEGEGGESLGHRRKSATRGGISGGWREGVLLEFWQEGEIWIVGVGKRWGGQGELRSGDGEFVETVGVGCGWSDDWTWASSRLGGEDEVVVRRGNGVGNSL